MESTLRKTHFAQFYRSFSTNRATIRLKRSKKSALKWISLIRTPILGQSPS